MYQPFGWTANYIIISISCIIFCICYPERNTNEISDKDHEKVKRSTTSLSHLFSFESTESKLDKIFNDDDDDVHQTPQQKGIHITTPIPIIPILDESIVEASLFHSMSKKTQPLYLCPQSSAQGVYHLPPIIPECPIVDTRKSSRPVNVSIWFPDPVSMKLKAYVCHKIKRTRTHNRCFIGGESRGHDFTKHSVEPDTCWTMVEKLVAPDGSQIKRIGAYQYGTDNDEIPEVTIMGTMTLTSVDYFFTEIQIAVSNTDETIISYVNLEDTCKVGKGSCKGQNEILVWKPEEYTSACRLVRTHRSACLLTDKRLTCPSEKLAIVELKTVSICNLNFAYSETGVLISQDDTKHGIAPDIVSTSTVEDIVSKKHNNAKRNRRDSQEKILRRLMRINHAGINNAQYQFLYDTLNENITFAIQSIHNDACVTQQQILQTLYYLAELNFPSVMVKSLTRDFRYEAMLAGDGISLTICEEIFNYRFLPDDDKICYREHPVEFESEYKTKKGYVEGLSHRIVFTPTIIDCPKPQFIFRYGNQSIILGNRTIIANIPHLPIPFGNSYNFKLPDLAWVGKGSLALSDIGGEDILRNAINQAGKANTLMKLAEKASSGTALNEQEKTIYDGFLSSIFSPFGNVLSALGAAIIGTLIIILVGVIIWKLVTK